MQEVERSGSGRLQRPGCWSEADETNLLRPARNELRRGRLVSGGSGTGRAECGRAHCLKKGAKQRPERRLFLFGHSEARARSNRNSQGAGRSEATGEIPQCMSERRRPEVICSPGRQRRAGEQITGGRRTKRCSQIINSALDLSGARRTEVLSSPERRRRTANSVLEAAERSGTDVRPLMAGPPERPEETNLLRPARHELRRCRLVSGRERSGPCRLWASIPL